MSGNENSGETPNVNEKPERQEPVTPQPRPEPEPSKHPWPTEDRVNTKHEHRESDTKEEFFPSSE